MKEILIEELAYLIKEAKSQAAPQPIFFLGAGASVSGNIPLANEIREKILKDYKSSPFIKKLKPEERNYAKLMGCLSPTQRTELLKSYIDKAKINVTHIYLAQLIKEGYADYVLTVNFDNLMLRALALYNIFPPTYDLSILKDLTTTTFSSASVTYLHGKYNGPWILNTEEEMARVKAIVQRIFDSIKNQRPWIFIGYSGSDPIFEHVKNLGRFDDGLYWVGYKKDSPDQQVRDFLNDINNNSSYVKGYDADAFMLKLNEELNLPQPEILSKPFSLLKGMLNEINDINDEDHFGGVKERLSIAKDMVSNAIKNLESGDCITPYNSEENILIDKLKKQVIELLVAESYGTEQINSIEKKIVKLNDFGANQLLSQYYYYWGNKLGDKTKYSPNENNDELFIALFDKYDRATSLNPNLKEAWLNWGIRLGDYAELKSDSQAEFYFLQAFEKYEKALSVNLKYAKAYSYWGTDLGALAELKQAKEAHTLYEKAYLKFEKALKIDSKLVDNYINFSHVLTSEAEMAEPDRAISLLEKATALCEKAITISSDEDIYFNWANALCKLGLLTEGEISEQYFLNGFDKYEKSNAEGKNNYEALNNWAGYLILFAVTKSKEQASLLIEKAIKLFRVAIEISDGLPIAHYNFGKALLFIYANQLGFDYQPLKQTLQLAKSAFECAKKHGDSLFYLSCCYALGREKESALQSLDQSLKRGLIDPISVLNNPHWQYYLRDPGFISVIDKYLVD